MARIRPSQALFSLLVLITTYLSYLALSPPNPTASPPPDTGDILRRLHITDDFTNFLLLAPTPLIASHVALLALFYPNIPAWLLRNGVPEQNALNTDLITWSSSTIVPLMLLLCIGIPLRLAAYASLGEDFTFGLAPPVNGGLRTTGLYGYLQHPSYTGLFITIVCVQTLFGRMDGVLSCWIKPRWYKGLRLAERWVTTPLGLALLLAMVGSRVREEERMLEDTFGKEWNDWRQHTARFVPGLF